MKIIIETIPHSEQRYQTCGDWFFDCACQGAPQDTCDLHIKVSNLSDWRLEALVAIHELVEVLKCKHDGVTSESVDAFDKAFEANRAPDNLDEPGDEPNAPYVKQHCLATGIERIMAAELGVSWKEYEKELESLP